MQCVFSKVFHSSHIFHIFEYNTVRDVFVCLAYYLKQILVSKKPVHILYSTVLSADPCQQAPHGSRQFQLGALSFSSHLNNLSLLRQHKETIHWQCGQTLMANKSCRVWTESIYLFLIYRNLFISAALIVPPLGPHFGPVSTLCKTIHYCASQSSDQIRLNRNASLDCFTNVFLKSNHENRPFGHFI